MPQISINIKYMGERPLKTKGFMNIEDLTAVVPIDMVEFYLSLLD